LRILNIYMCLRFTNDILAEILRKVKKRRPKCKEA
jgi:hypothetical protein